MENEYVIVAVRLLAGMVAGALIGLERTYHGRAAGFRTFTLVCTASSLLMLLTVFSERAIPNVPVETINLDPTRMAQGIMTGIGFLGAGVIIQERFTIRGLTTAASIWMTAAIGIIIGMGLYFAAFLAEIIALGTLAVFGWIERRVPTQVFGRLVIEFEPEGKISEDELRTLIAAHDMSFTHTSYHMENGLFRYEMTVRTEDEASFGKLADTLKGMRHVAEFSIAPSAT